jgi:hypothetical protein
MRHQLRISRPVSDLDRSLVMYSDGLGLRSPTRSGDSPHGSAGPSAFMANVGPLLHPGSRCAVHAAGADRVAQKRDR